MRVFPRGTFAWTAWVVAFVALFVSRAAFAFTPPAIEGPVTDPSHILQESEKSALNQKLRAYKNGAGFEVAVFLTSSLNGEAIEDVAYTTARTWGVGDKEKDNGVLLLISTGDRKIRIETGKGVGGSLTDLQSNDIIRNRIAPEMKAGRVAAAVNAGIDGIAQALGGKYVAVSPRATRAPPSVASTLVIIVLIILFVILISRRGGGGGGGIFFIGGGGGGGWSSGGGGGGWGGGDSGGSWGGGGGDFGGGGSSGDY